MVRVTSLTMNLVMFGVMIVMIVMINFNHTQKNEMVTLLK